MTQMSVSEILQRTVVVLARTRAGVRRAVEAPARLLPVAAAVVEAAQAVYAMLRVRGRRVVLAADRCEWSDGLEVTAPVDQEAEAVVAARRLVVATAKEWPPACVTLGPQRGPSPASTLLESLENSPSCTTQAKSTTMSSLPLRSFCLLCSKQAQPHPLLLVG